MNNEEKKSIIAFITAHLIPIISIVVIVTIYIGNLQLNILQMRNDIDAINGHKNESMIREENEFYRKEAKEKFLLIKKDIEESTTKLENNKHNLINTFKIETNKMIDEASSRLNNISNDLIFQKKELQRISSKIKGINSLKQINKKIKESKIELTTINVAIKKIEKTKVKKEQELSNVAKVLENIKSNQTQVVSQPIIPVKEIVIPISVSPIEACHIQYVASTNEKNIDYIHKSLKKESFESYKEYDPIKKFYKIKIGQTLSKKESENELKRIKKKFPRSKNTKSAYIICN